MNHSQSEKENTLKNNITSKSDGHAAIETKGRTTTMPIIIAAAAAMKYYYKSNEHKIRVIDPCINLKQKSTVRLHAIEQTMTIYEPPISTITYCQSMTPHSDTFVTSVQQRLEDIIQANPWLCGWLLPMPDLHIVYDPTGRDRTPSYFIVHSTPRPRRHLVVKGSDDTDDDDDTQQQQHEPHDDYHYATYKDGIVLSNKELIGRNQPIFKVSIIPILDQNAECHDNDDKDDDDGNNDAVPNKATTSSEYAVVMSMSHLVGDAHTYYQIYNMLLYASTIQSLNPVRISNYVSTVQDIFGNDHSSTILNIHQQQQQLPASVPLGKSAVPEEVTNKLKAKLHTFMKNVNAKRASYVVNKNGSNHQNSNANMTEVGDDVTIVLEDTVRSSFSLVPTDLDTSFDSNHSSNTTYSSKSIDESTSHNDSTDDLISTIPTVSSNITSSLAEEATISVLPKLQKRVMKVFRISDEWISAQRSESCVDSNDTHVSINSLISAWFYRITQASTCILMMNLRHKVDDHCRITNIDAGNYAHAVTGHDKEFYHAVRIQNAVSNITTAATTAAAEQELSSLSMQEKKETSLNLSNDKETCNKATVAICTNWVNFPQMLNESICDSNRSNDSESTGCQIQLHLPVYANNNNNNNMDQSDFPMPDVAVLTLFHLQQSTKSGNRRSQDQMEPIGAMVLCNEEVWLEHIVPSQMVVPLDQW